MARTVRLRVTSHGLRSESRSEPRPAANAALASHPTAILRPRRRPRRSLHPAAARRFEVLGPGTKHTVKLVLTRM
eukprot:750306-Hanusia_phi.AAC.3